MRMYSTDILMLQETKIEEEALLFLSKTKWKMNVGKAVNVRGTSWGLATLWCEDNFHLKISLVTQHWIFTKLQHISSKISMALFNIYVPVNCKEKKECWNSLPDFLEIYSPTNIIVAWDLNIILDPKEKKGGVHGKDPLQESVESLIQASNLLDLKAKKARFTWSNNIVGDTNITACLDMFLVQSSLMEGKFIISTKILPKLTSDHHPISLMFEEEENLGPIPLCFSPLWIERDSF